MDFEFSEEHKMLRQAIRDFAEKEIAPLVDEAEAKEKSPKELFPKMGKLGYLCLSYPAKYGAADMGLIGECIVIEEISRVAVGIAAGLMAQGGISTSPIVDHGTEEQKQKYLMPAIKGQKIGAFGRPIYKFQAISFRLARMAMNIEAARWLMYRAAWMYDQGMRRFNEAAMTKLFASEVAVRVTSEAMQIHGGVALMSESPVQRYFRDSRRTTITEGTNEIQQIIILQGLGLR